MNSFKFKVTGIWQHKKFKIQQQVCVVTQSRPTLCDPMAVGHQAPLSIEISRQEY